MFCSRYFGLTFLAVIASTGSAFADQYYFQSAGSIAWNGVYVNPYVATDQTHPQGPITVYCDDWNTDFSGNPTWTGDVLALNKSNLSSFKYGNPATFTTDYLLKLNVFANPSLNYLTATSQATTSDDLYNRYLEAAWLDNQWQTLGGSSHTQISIAAAEWTLFVDSAHVGDAHSGLLGAINSSGYANDVYSYLQSAHTAVASGYSAPNWDVLVPRGVNSNGEPMQEFLFDSPVPEPGAFILLGTVVGLLALTRLRRRRSDAAAGIQS
jgi:hypothetical protein